MFKEELKKSKHIKIKCFFAWPTHNPRKKEKEKKQSKLTPNQTQPPYTRHPERKRMSGWVQWCGGITIQTTENTPPRKEEDDETIPMMWQNHYSNHRSQPHALPKGGGAANALTRVSI